MAGADFYGPWLKVKRAKHHIDHLERLFEDYVYRNMQSARRQRQGNPGRKAARIGTALPEDVPTILGDAIHNLRVALDHAFCALVVANGGTVNDYTRFHFGKDRQSLKGSINGQKPESLPAPHIVDFILSDIQPYEGGKLGLYELHRLDITDKHLVLIPTTRIVHVEQMEILDKEGRTRATIKGLNLARPNNPNQTGGALAVEGGTLKLHGDPKSAFEILFADDQPFAGESVLQKMNTLFNNVSTALKSLEAVFSS